MGFSLGASGSQPALGAEMRPGRGPRFCGARLLLLVLLVLPGHGNQGSKAGSCPCMKRFPSSSPPTEQRMDSFRRLLETFDPCFRYVRFHLHTQPRRNVCGGSSDRWVLDLMACFNKRECGYNHSHSQSMARQEHLPPPSHQVLESTEKTSLKMSTTAQTSLSPTLQSTQQPALPGATPALDNNFTQTSENTTFTVGQNLGTALEIREKKKGNEGSAAGTSALVPVLSLLGIFLVLTVIILCRRTRQSLHSSPDFSSSVPTWHQIPLLKQRLE